MDMAGFNRSLTLCLVAIFAISTLTTVNHVCVQSSLKPSVPEFKVRYTNYSKDVPANTVVDPFTGKTETNPAQHIEHETIDIVIKNQTISSSDYLYYKIRMKGHFSQQWTNISFIQANPNSENTSVSYASSGAGKFYFDSTLFSVSSGGMIDFQVQAQVWTYVQSDDLFGSWNQVISGASDWSTTQTITIGDGLSTPTISASPSQNPTSTLDHPDTVNQVLFGWSSPEIAIAVLLVVVAVLLVLVVVFLRRRSAQ
jgi:hypothetical protein